MNPDTTYIYVQEICYTCLVYATALLENFTSDKLITTHYANEKFQQVQGTHYNETEIQSKDTIQLGNCFNRTIIKTHGSVLCGPRNLGRGR